MSTLLLFFYFALHHFGLDAVVLFMCQISIQTRESCLDAKIYLNYLKKSSEGRRRAKGLCECLWIKVAPFFFFFRILGGRG
jgi:hypothetical protein